jgi:hypothetical protein
MFGMGFFAIFNPKLSTERVVVTTCCEGSSVEVSFHVETPGKCPKISLRVLDEPLPFSTRIEVQFNRITLLCKYERLIELEIASLGKGGHGMYYDLRDYYESGFCVFRGIRDVLNCNSLSVTISRDSFYLDWNYQAMKTILSIELLKHFGSEEHHWNDSELVLANQYVFRKRLKAILAGEQATPDIKAVKPYEALQGLYRGLDPGRAVITYCHSARRGSFGYFVLRLMGFEDVMLYEPFWMEWGNKRYYYPVETAGNVITGYTLPGTTSTSAAFNRRETTTRKSGAASASGGGRGSKSGYVSCGG